MYKSKSSRTKTRNIVGVTNKKYEQQKLPPIYQTQFPYEVHRSVEKLAETNEELNKPFVPHKPPEAPKRIFNIPPEENIPKPPEKQPLEILASEDEESLRKGEGSQRALYLEPELLRETSERIRKTSYFPLTQSQSEAITRKQVEQKLVKLSGYFVENNEKKYKYMKDGFRNLDREKTGHISLADFTEFVTKSGLCHESEAALLFHTQDTEKKGYIRFDQFITLLDTQKLNKPRFYQLSDIQMDEKTKALRKRGESVKLLVFDQIRQKSKSRKDYRSNTDQLLSIFRQMDYRKDGFLTYNDVKEALGPKVLHLNLKDQEVYDLCRSIDITGTGTIDYVSWFCEMGEVDIEDGYDPFFCSSKNILKVLKQRTQEHYDPPPNKHVYTGIIYPQDGDEIDEYDGTEYENPPRTLNNTTTDEEQNDLCEQNPSDMSIKFNITKNQKLFTSTLPSDNESLRTIHERNRQFVPATRFSSTPNQISSSYKLGLSHFPKYSPLAINPNEQFLTTNQLEYRADRPIMKSDEIKQDNERKLAWAQHKYNHFQEQMDKSQQASLARDDNFYKGRVRGRIQQHFDYDKCNFERNYYTQLNERVNPHQDKVNKFYQVSPNSMFAKHDS